MPPSNSSETTSGIKNQKHICPKCNFDNQVLAVYCEICFYPLNVSQTSSKQPPAPKPQLDQQPSNPPTSFSQELQKPSVISGLAVLAFAIALWINYFIARQPKYLTSSKAGNEIALYDSMSQVKQVPSGLFSYGGALYFASLVAHGMNEAILENHSNFTLRYTKPRNHDQSYANGVKMLLDGELSFAFNGRSLTTQEYAQANLRGISLQQVPLAIDGIIFYGNQNTKVDGLSLNAVRDIFTGKITNWQELGGANIAITPIMLTPDNIETLSLNDLSVIPPTTRYVENYTQALRKVIATPGAISFVSASLAQKQQLIKVFSLAEENSTNYIAPFNTTDEPNLELFKNGNYPLTRRLFLVIRQDGTPDQLAGKAYAEMLLSNQGQEIVEESGFVPLYQDR
jgi:phosphate transport system substrate-binding protein